MATTVIEAVANRGKQYRVVFHGDKPFRVSVLYRNCCRPDGPMIERKLWRAGDLPISLAAFCAINAARRKLGEIAAPPR